MDKIDQSLISLLSENSSEATSVLAKRLGVTRDKTEYRLKQLVESGLIRNFFTSIDLSRLGFIHVEILFELRVTRDADLAKMIAFAKELDFVTSVARCEGNFQLIISLRVRSLSVALNFLSDFVTRFNKFIFNRLLQILVASRFLKRGEKKAEAGSSPSRDVTLVPASEAFQIDDIDAVILKELAKNSRTQSSDISRLLLLKGAGYSMTREAVAYRIKKLEKCGIINGYTLVLDPSFSSQLYYRVFVKIESVQKTELRALIKAIHSHPRVVFFIQALGEWDFEFDMEVPGTAQAHETITEITRAHSRAIRSYMTILVTERHKYDYSQVISPS